MKALYINKEGGHGTERHDSQKVLTVATIVTTVLFPNYTLLNSVAVCFATDVVRSI